MATAPEAWKHRVLFFASDPPGQAERAYELLKGLDNFKAEHGNSPNSLNISYDLRDYCLENLERALIKEGFIFDETALSHIGHKLIHYREDVEYHNLATPEWHGKERQREIFVKAYEHHLHGDHDDTPPELREYK